MNTLALHDIAKIERESSTHTTATTGEFLLIKITLTDSRGNEFILNIYPTDELAKKLSDEMKQEGLAR